MLHMIWQRIELMQLAWIRHIQSALTPIRPLAPSIDLFDSAIMVLSVILMSWRSLAIEKAFRITHWFFLSELANELLKNCFQEPRPLQVDSSLAWIYHSTFSFPSGAAQSSVIYFAIACYLSRHLAVRLSLLLFALLLSFSRVMLGAHYPTDIAAGWIVGGAVIAFERYLLSSWLHIWTVAPQPRLTPWQNRTFDAYNLCDATTSTAIGWSLYLLAASSLILLASTDNHTPIEAFLNYAWMLLGLLAGKSLFRSPRQSLFYLSMCWWIGVWITRDPLWFNDSNWSLSIARLATALALAAYSAYCELKRNHRPKKSTAPAWRLLDKQLSNDV